MNETLTNYVSFFKDQINEMLIEYRRLLRAPMKQLLTNGLVHYATVHGISKERGHVICRFNKKYSPRLKVQRSMILIKRAARERWGALPYDWNCSFEEFLSREEYHTASSTVLPLYFLPGKEPECVYVGCGDINTRMFRKIENAMAEGIKIHVLFFETEPPTRYLSNLCDYVERNSTDKILMSTPAIAYDDWKPQLLAYSPTETDGISKTLLKALESQWKVVLQGPPGTGKSYSAAQVIAAYLGNKQSVCVTAMANSALMELIKQPPLEQFLAAGKLSKTMLTSDEAVSAKGLKESDADCIAQKGEAVFATYYKLSRLFRDIVPGAEKPLYDLIIVEEASQAYLTTIAACLRLGAHCLVVGDPMQLAPIIVSETKPEYKKWNARTQADGLTSFVLGNAVPSYRITTTFRLTEPSAALTGIFYGNTLKSVAPRHEDWSQLDNRYFPANGGVVIDVLAGGEDGVLSIAAASRMEMIIDKLEKNMPDASLAIITPFKDSAKAIQRRFSFENRKLKVSVETIDRVQGATVDYTILYFPLRNAGFALNDRRFNVATSRSRTTTLILSDFDLLSMRSITGKVREFLEKVEGVYQAPPSLAPEPQEKHVPAAIQPLTPESSNAASEHALGEPSPSASISSPSPLDASSVRKRKDEVQVILAIWLQTALKGIWKEKLWEKGVLEKLSDDQRKNAVDDGAKGLDQIDFASLISVFIGNFYLLRQNVHVRYQMLDMAKHIKTIRNDDAHKGAREIMKPNQKELQYDLDTLDRFVEGLNASDVKVPIM